MSSTVDEQPVMNSTATSRLLGTPLELGPMALRNRIVFAAHLTNFAERGLPTEQHVAYYAARARGGAGLVITEEHSVHPGDRPYEKLIRGYDPAVLPGYRALTDAVHEHGAVILAQLNHNGAQSSGRYSREPVWAPSAVPDPMFGEVPVAMTKPWIDELIYGYADVARRCVEGGFDGVEVQCSQASIIRQFLNPATNRRVDEYGGPPANRTRFLLEVLDAVRAALGPGRLLGVRLGCDDLTELDQLTEVAKLVSGTGNADYLNASVGVAGTSQDLITPPMGSPAGYAMTVSTTLRAASGLPVVGIGRFTTAEQVEKVLAEEGADLVGVVRGQICDPDAVSKWLAGQQARTCLGCNQECIGRVGRNRTIGCAMNPRAGREWLPTLQQVAQPKRVLIVGGGPAGLRAAATAAARGHRVTVCEASQDLGGQLRLAASAPGRAELGLAVQNLLTECMQAGVTLQTGVTVDPEYIEQFHADAVVLATGSAPVAPPWVVPGVLDVSDVLAGRARPSGSVLVYDELGFHQASSVALLLAERGCAVWLMTPAMVAAQDLGVTLDQQRFRRRAASLGIRFGTDRVIMSASASGASVAEVAEAGSEISGAATFGVAVRVLHHPTGEIETCEFNSVVCALPAQPVDRLWGELVGATASLPMYRVGDCVAPRRLDAAISEGDRIGSAL